MSGMPMPPKMGRAVLPEEVTPVEEHWKRPPDEKPDNRLTDIETDFILSTTLKPEQRDDPGILEFIKHYLTCRHVGQASKMAGLKGAHVGAALLKKPEIYKCIEQITQKATMKYGYDASEVIERVKEIAGIDPIEFENADGSFKTHMSQIAPEARRAIKKFKAKNIWGEDPNGMKIVIGQMIEVELWDKVKAAEMLGRDKGIFKETKVLQHDVTTNMSSYLLESKARAEQRRIEMARSVGEVRVIEGKVEDAKE